MFLEVVANFCKERLGGAIILSVKNALHVVSVSDDYDVAVLNLYQSVFTVLFKKSLKATESSGSRKAYSTTASR